jgi:hypothetical protein
VSKANNPLLFASLTLIGRAFLFLFLFFPLASHSRGSAAEGEGQEQGEKGLASGALLQDNSHWLGFYFVFWSLALPSSKGRDEGWRQEPRVSRPV